MRDTVRNLAVLMLVVDGVACLCGSIGLILMTVLRTKSGFSRGLIHTQWIMTGVAVLAGCLLGIFALPLNVFN